MQIVAIGQDSHRFEEDNSIKPLVLCGVTIPNCPGLSGNSDADVALHAITNAVSGVTTVNILGTVTDKLCFEEGIKDSTVYLAEAMKYLGKTQLLHLSLSFECARPKLQAYIPEMRKQLALLTGLSEKSIGITATSGEGLTAFGRGEGIFCTALLTADRSF